MEASFQYDFSSVRVHADGPAAQAARALGAGAFTLGNDVYFAADRYQPETERGRRLMAHELAHVMQQRGLPRMPSSPALPVSMPGDALERDADRTAAAALDARRGARPALLATAPMIQRQTPVEFEVPTPSERERLRQQGVQLPVMSAVSADPRTHGDYIDRRMTAVGYSIYLAGCFVYCEGLSLPVHVRDAFIDTTLTDASPVDLAIFPSRDEATRLIPYGPRAPGQAEPYAYYRGAGGQLVAPTIFSPATTPRIVAALLDARRRYAEEVQRQLTVLALSIVGGMVLRFLVGRLLRIGAGPEPATPPALRSVRAEADRLARAARERGEPVVVNLGGAGAPHEPPNAINVNNQAVARRGIPNLVEADGSEVGQLFAPSSVDRVVGYNMAPGVIDWGRAAPGAYRVLKPGGTFRYSYRGANRDAAVLGQALQAAGFRNVQVQANVLVTAVR